MLKIPKWLQLLALVSVIGLLTLLFRPSPIQVEVASIEARPFFEAVETQGRTRGINPYLITAPISGRLLRTELDEGASVRSGQVLARIAATPQDSRTLAFLQANLAAAQARHGAAQAALDETASALARATQELSRREELFRNKLASAEETETYRQLVVAEQARQRSANAYLAAAEAEIATARSFLMGVNSDSDAIDDSIITVIAPVDGTVYQVFEENERVIAAGTLLFEISNQDELEVVADILTQDAIAIEPGDTVYISGWGGDQTINALVRNIEPEAFTKVSALGVEEQRVNVIIDLINLPPNLGAEYRVTTQIVTWQANEVLTIPTSAIFQRSDGWNTFVVVDGSVETRVILIGARGRDHTRIIGGIREGERVILYPSDLINEGTAVSY